MLIDDPVFSPAEHYEEIKMVNEFLELESPQITPESAPFIKDNIHMFISFVTIELQQQLNQSEGNMDIDRTFVVAERSSATSIERKILC